MPLPDANNYSMRIYELLKETDLENLSYAQFQGVAEKLFIEPENEDEMRRLVLVQLARMAVRGDWDGFLNKVQLSTPEQTALFCYYVMLKSAVNDISKMEDKSLVYA